jgi:hypothetical protein
MGRAGGFSRMQLNQRELRTKLPRGLESDIRTGNKQHVLLSPTHTQLYTQMFTHTYIPLPQPNPSLGHTV